MAEPAPAQAPAKPHGQVDIELFMAHLLRCPTVSRQAKSVVKVNYFREGGESAFKLIWATALDFWENHGVQLIPIEHMYSALQQRMGDSAEFQSAERQQMVLETAYRVYCYDAASLIPDVACQQIEDFVLMRGLAPKAQEALEMGASGLREFLAESRKLGASTTTIASEEGVKPFIQGDEKLGVEPRRPCGVRFIDAMLKGGPRPREVYGLLGMSGGGKTTLSNQVAIESARKRRRAAVFTYEEPLSNEYFLPVYACASQVSRDLLENLGPGGSMADLPPDMAAKVRTSMAEIDNYIEFHDMSGPRGVKGISGIEATLERCRDKGEPVETVVIDWFWILVMRQFNAGRRGRQDQERIFSQGVLDELKEMAARQNVWVLVNQQIAPGEGNKGRKKHWSDSAEVKSFAWLLNGCFVLEPMNDQQICNLHLSKGRSLKTSSTLLKLDGEHATFVSLSGDVCYDKRLKKYVPKDQMNKVPGVDDEKIDTSLISYDETEFA